ncbi:hypothetical protein Ancab_009928 [Ancistrocladus abbreviatus]
MEWEEGQLSIARAVDENIILSQTISGYDQNLWHLSGNQDDPKVKTVGDDFELEVQRATWSLTLKDSKFPPYLMLNLKGRESEGTLIMKGNFYYRQRNSNGRHRSQMEKKQVDDTKLLTYMRSFVSMVELVDVEDNKIEDDADRSLKIFSASQRVDDDNNLIEVQDHSPNVEHREKLPIQELMDLEEQSGMKMKKPYFDEEGIKEIEVAKTKSIASLDVAETFSTSCSEMNMKKDDVFLHEGSNYAWELLDTQGTSKRTTRCKRPVKDSEEMRKFNPQEPNYLPVEPEIEGERVDLRHQEIDKRKNAEEWMLDYALQRAVSKLTLARKRKVALLVVAFETVMPIPKCETHLRQHTIGFAHARPMQACS